MRVLSFKTYVIGDSKSMDITCIFFFMFNEKIYGHTLLCHNIDVTNYE